MIFKAKLEKRIKLTPTVILVSLSLKKPISFKAGQYIAINIPTSDGIAERPFSIASPPHQNKNIELLIKLIPGGLASTFFEQKEVGSEISLSGPRGTFGLIRYKNPVHFIASSTGIAPFRSMLYNKLGKGKTAHPIHLTLGAPTSEEMIMEKEMDGLTKKHDNFFCSLITTANPSDYPDIYLENIDLKQKNDFYLCGGPNFVEDIKNALLNRGIKKSRIHHEKFK